MKKVFSIIVILIFIGIAFTPTLSGNDLNNRVESELTAISISTYENDGIVEKTTVKLYIEEALELAKQLKETNNHKKRFSLFKKYGLIPKDVTREQLRQKMLKYAAQIGLTRNKMDSIFKKFANGRRESDRWFAANYLNAIEGVFVFNYNLPLGLSMFTGTPNLALYAMHKDLLPSADILYIALSPLGFYEFVEGELPDFHLFSLGAFGLIGFVGYVVSSPLFGIGGYMVGYAVISFAFGFIRMGPLPSI